MKNSENKKFKYSEWCPELYEELSAPFPAEAIQKSDGRKTGKGYDTTGYKSQFMINRLNELIGPAGWSDDYEIVKEEIRGKALDITVNATITILGVIKKSPGGHSGYKGHYDTLKGACSNALKAGLRKFGIGRQAWENAIDEDYTNGDEKPQSPKKPANTPQKPAAGNNDNSKITESQHKTLMDLRDSLKLTPEEIKEIVGKALGTLKKADDFTIIEANKVLAEIKKIEKERTANV